MSQPDVVAIPAELMAVPATAGRFDAAAQARWVLEGRSFARIE